MYNLIECKSPVWKEFAEGLKNSSSDSIVSITIVNVSEFQDNNQFIPIK